MYCAPRLYSGLATLLLSPSEVSSLYSHQKVTLERLQQLYPRTPAPAVYFLSGALPAPAILHMRQFGLLGMIAKLGPGNILWKHGFYILNHHIKHSWFSQVRELALKYSLPDPVLTLTSPPLSKPAWKGTVRLSGACPALAHSLARALLYWRKCLSSLPHLLPPVQAALLSSPEAFTTFLLDPSTDPGVISLVQLHGPGVLEHYFRLSRSWIWAAHRRRLLLLGLHTYLV